MRIQRPDEVPFGYCECGCGQRTNIAKVSQTRRGWVKGQPMRFLAGHSLLTSTPEYLIDEDTGCWVWQRTKNECGYGRKWDRVRQQMIPAHRFVYERERGSVPLGLFFDHLCRNPSCVNPDHVEPVTHKENVRRGLATKLDWERVRAIREATKSTAELAAEFSVSRSTIHRILRMTEWWPPHEDPCVRRAA